MSAYRDIAEGLKTVLENNIPGLKAFAYPPDSINSFPAAAILPDPIDTEIAFEGNTFTCRFRIVFLVTSGDSAEGFLKLYDYIDPTEANKSVIKAVRTDPTLGAKADDSDVIRIETIGRRELWGGWYFGFDAIIEVVKTVA